MYIRRAVVLAWELPIITITEWIEKMELKITMIGGSVRNGLGDEGCSLNTIYVRTDKSWKPVDEEGCIPPGQEHRELLVEMSCSCALVLPSLPGLSRGQLLHLLHTQAKENG